jgi:hypothetical protein
MCPKEKYQDSPEFNHHQAALKQMLLRYVMHMLVAADDDEYFSVFSAHLSYSRSTSNTSGKFALQVRLMRRVLH